jgi:aryl-phospho-beta-D-glucosidase BglC (GH1 family)
MKRIAALLLALALLLGISCGAEEAVPPVETEYNEADLAAYAACINGLAVRYGVPVILWDCSTHVNRASLSLNHPAYVEAIMACYPPCADPGNAGDDAVFEEESAREAADRFGPGFNLGNTLDATSYNIGQEQAGTVGWIVQWGRKDADGRVYPDAWETAWGQPETDQAIADYIISLGFNVIRVPVTWAEHMDRENRIDERWMARVKETVDYFYGRGVYVILNMHHDGGADGWIEATEASYNTYGERFASVWTQIAETFANYDERLLFESMNEVLDGANNWNAPSPDASRWINAWNQLFVTTVRATGGNNALRNLIVMTYSGGGADGNFSSFVMPEDSTDHHLLITVHNYDPQAFTWTNATWTRMTARWDGAVHGALLEREFQLYQRYAEQFGVPVVVGEYNADPKRYADYD